MRLGARMFTYHIDIDHFTAKRLARSAFPIPTFTRVLLTEKEREIGRAHVSEPKGDSGDQARNKKEMYYRTFLFDDATVL